MYMYLYKFSNGKVIIGWLKFKIKLSLAQPQINQCMRPEEFSLTLKKRLYTNNYTCTCTYVHVHVHVYTILNARQVQSLFYYNFHII